MILDGIDVSKLKRVRRYERGAGTNRDNKRERVVSRQLRTELEIIY